MHVVKVESKWTLMFSLWCVCVRHERAQLQESQYLPDKRQAREHTDGAETEWETLPGGFSRK